MGGTGGTGAVERADTEVHGFERPVAINEDGRDPVTLAFARRQHSHFAHNDWDRIDLLLSGNHADGAKLSECNMFRSISVKY